ncbi:MAG: DCC1-like thiol-disulfide oxidoreductase family protein [Rhodothermales bacterium]|nr:DCC1-like thiol-disulfide oxidoreductase family protein [Rhodothermales bacterium]
MDSPDPTTRDAARAGSPSAGHALVLFDGVCNLCNGSVHFVIDRDPESYFRFAALQSEAAKPALAQCGRDAGVLDSIVLIEEGQCYTRSSAALRIARRLSGGWPVVYAGIIIPRVLRDAIYDFIARNRYRWFGRTEACRIPTLDLRARFLDDPVG